jgi:hypothetical protein
MAEDIAKETNATTKAQLAATDDVAATFDARRSESPSWAVGTASRGMSFAQMEAGKQAPGARMKTWIVTASNSAHPELNGETVPLDQPFSSGSMGPPTEHPGCECLMEVI